MYLVLIALFSFRSNKIRKKLIFHFIVDYLSIIARFSGK